MRCAPWLQTLDENEVNNIRGNIPVADGRGRGKMMLSADSLRRMIRKRRKLAKTGRTACRCSGERTA